jgi:hypothetical protein
VSILPIRAIVIVDVAVVEWLREKGYSLEMVIKTAEEEKNSKMNIRKKVWVRIDSIE